MTPDTTSALLKWLLDGNQPSYRQTILSILPIPLLIILLIISVSGNIEIHNEPPGLFSALNALFLTIFPLLVTYFATKGYLHSGLFSMLMLGSGALTLCLSGALSGFILIWQNGGPYPAVTIFTWLLILQIIFHLAGGVSVFVGVHPGKDSLHRGLIVTFTYIGLASVSVLLAGMVLKDVLPLLLIEGYGATTLRQSLIASGTTASAIGGILLLSFHLLSKTRFSYWYSMTMFLFTTSGISYLFVKSVGGSTAWVARISLYLASIYLFIAIISAIKELRSRGESLEEGVPQLFRHHLDLLVEQLYVVRQNGNFEARN